MYRPGDRIVDRYEVIREISRGGQAVVYLVRDQAAPEDAPLRRAVKVANPDYRTQMTPRLQREYRISAYLREDPEAVIVGVLDWLPDALATVMEYYDAPNLWDLRTSRGGCLDRVLALEIARQAAEVVARIHRRGVIHRDLTPTNLLVHDQDGRSIVRVIDFGISKRVSPESNVIELTSFGARLGTKGYAAPEQWRDASSANDRADVFTLGVVVYELLQGTRPYPDGCWGASSEGWALRGIVSPVSVDAITVQIPETARAAICAALSPDPITRPTASKFAADLRTALEEIGDGRTAIESRRAQIAAMPILAGVGAPFVKSASPQRPFERRPPVGEGGDAMEAAVGHESDDGPNARLVLGFADVVNWDIQPRKGPPTDGKASRREEERTPRSSEDRKRPRPWLFALVPVVLGIVGMVLYNSWQDPIHELVRGRTASIACLIRLRCEDKRLATNDSTASTVMDSTVKDSTGSQNAPDDAGSTQSPQTPLPRLPDRPERTRTERGGPTLIAKSDPEPPESRGREPNGRVSTPGADKHVTPIPVEPEVPLVSMRYLLPRGYRFDRATVDGDAIQLVNQSSNGRYLQFDFPFRDGMRVVDVWSREVVSDLEHRCRTWHLPIPAGNSPVREC